jgi:DNA repair protein RadA/Sms
MIVAVLTSHLKLKLHEKEIYINISGSVKSQESSSDLAVAVCLFSSIFEVPISKDIMCFGEISLSGDIKPVQFMENRIKEAIKLGYTTIFCPPLPDTIKHLLKSAEIIEVKNLKMLRYLIK